MLKLCVLNVKTRLLYYKAKLMLVFPHVSEQGRMFLNLFYRNNLKIRKESPNSSLEEKKKPKTPNATTGPPTKKKKFKLYNSWSLLGSQL